MRTASSSQWYKLRYHVSKFLETTEPRGLTIFCVQYFFEVLSNQGQKNVKNYNFSFKICHNLQSPSLGPSISSKSVNFVSKKTY